MPVANIPGLPPASQHEAQQHAPHTGENGAEILTELGYSVAEIEAMFSRGGVRAPATLAKAAD
jgi:crotonobetainyl-CoA:carnitine CoA-transferase CaiB-like acyl-CoA transferase